MVFKSQFGQSCGKLENFSISRKRLVECLSHKVHLDVTQVVIQDEQLSNLLKSVHGAMVQARTLAV